MSTRRRVVVTGLGLVSPLGTGVEYNWQQLINNKSGIKDISQYINTIQYKDITSHIGGIIEQGNYNEHKYNINEWVPKNMQSTTSLFIQYAMCASQQAIDDSEYKPTTDEQRERYGVCIGSGIGSIEESYIAGNALYNKDNKQRHKLSAYAIPRLLVNLASGHISIQHKLYGINHSVSTACTTGAHSIGDAYRFIRDNDADIILCGGSEASVTPISMALFSRCKALSTKYNNNPIVASRPFDTKRDGFVMGEGSGIMILEELEHAKKRNAHIYSEIVGYGYSSDGYHITAPSSNGRGAQLCMNNALKYAQLQPSDIGYINAHATSTPCMLISLYLFIQQFIYILCV